MKSRLRDNSWGSNGFPMFIYQKKRKSYEQTTDNKEKEVSKRMD